MPTAVNPCLKYATDRQQQQLKTRQFRLLFGDLSKMREKSGFFQGKQGKTGP
jgi:hypothetical protein